MSTFFLIEVIKKDGKVTIIVRDGQQHVIDIFNGYDELSTSFLSAIQKFESDKASSDK